jgi:hypothetical protein
VYDMWLSDSIVRLLNEKPGKSQGREACHACAVLCELSALSQIIIILVLSLDIYAWFTYT